MNIDKYLSNISNVFIQGPVAQLCQKYVSSYYRKLERRKKHNPEQSNWYDNRIRLFRWSNHLDPGFAERGIFSRMVMKPGCSVLDLGSGGGFYPYYFYSTIASLIDCIDIDEGAIKHAKQYHSHPNIRYFFLDAIHEPFPQKKYDVIIMDGSLAHFTSNDLEILLAKIKEALGEDGVFAGYEEMETLENKSWDHHLALPTIGDFHNLLSSEFKYVKVLERPKKPKPQKTWAGRKLAFFRCSDNDTLLNSLDFQ